MLIFNELNAESALPVSGELRLSYEWRQKSRFLAVLISGPQAGEEIGVRIARGQVLQDGDLLACRPSADSHIVQIICVRAAAEQLLHVTAATTLQLTRIAYHLGNRHVPVQVGLGGESQAQQLWLRLQLDHVLENMVDGLGGTVQVLSAPFEPESGAYGQGLGSSHDHEHSAAAHEHSAEHDHSHDHRHDDRRHAPKIHDFLK
jgi:urease accessory protein